MTRLQRRTERSLRWAEIWWVCEMRTNIALSLNPEWAEAFRRQCFRFLLGFVALKRASKPREWMRPEKEPRLHFDWLRYVGRVNRNGSRPRKLRLLSDPLLRPPGSVCVAKAIRKRKARIPRRLIAWPARRDRNDEGRLSRLTPAQHLLRQLRGDPRSSRNVSPCEAGFPKNLTTYVAVFRHSF